jgi:hypothetical protein
MPWSLRGEIQEIRLCSLNRLYWLLVLPLASLAPATDLVLYLIAPFHSALLSRLNLFQLAYNFIRDTAYGIIFTVVAAKIILFCSPYVSALKDNLRAHHLAAIAMIPIFLAITVRPFAEGWAALVELIAVFYSCYLLAAGMHALLGGDAARSRNHALLISLNMLLFSYLGDWVLIELQMFGAGLLHAATPAY